MLILISFEINFHFNRYGIPSSPSIWLINLWSFYNSFLYKIIVKIIHLSTLIIKVCGTSTTHNSFLASSQTFYMHDIDFQSKSVRHHVYRNVQTNLFWSLFSPHLLHYRSWFLLTHTLALALYRHWCVAVYICDGKFESIK